MELSRASGASVNVIVTALGALVRFAPAAGSEDTSSAWAAAGFARPMSAASARPAGAAIQPRGVRLRGGLVVGRRIGLLWRRLRATAKRHEERGSSDENPKPADYDAN